MQARALLKAVPKGNYVFIKGDKGDPNADFLRAGPGRGAPRGHRLGRHQERR